MKSKIVLTQDDFLSGIVVDTRINLEVVNVTDELAVSKRAMKLYGSAGVMVGDTYTVSGDASAFKSVYSIGDLMGVMEKLTSENGCPWDMAQTHESIRLNMIEEAYELVDAINNNDVPNIVEECGDVLLQSVFHANIAERNGGFDLDDVVSELCKKLVSRHTHIFGDNKASNAEEALMAWENAKAKENKPSVSEKLVVLEKSMPSLIYAQKAMKALKKAGVKIDSVPLDKNHLINVLAGLIANGVDVEVELRSQVQQLIDSAELGKK